VGPIDFSHLFVTSSFDWTVKLWTTKVRIAWLKFSGTIEGKRMVFVFCCRVVGNSYIWSYI
jgi:hypothetical protein